MTMMKIVCECVCVLILDETISSLKKKMKKRIQTITGE